jgi:hypothetical protein
MTAAGRESGLHRLGIDDIRDSRNVPKHVYSAVGTGPITPPPQPGVTAAVGKFRSGTKRR